MKLKCADDAIKEMEYYVTDNKESLKVEWPENIFNYKEFFELLLSTNDAYLVDVGVFSKFSMSGTRGTIVRRIS